MPKNENKRRTIWFPDDLWDKISNAAGRDNRTVSSWLRSRAVDALDRETRRILKSGTMLELRSKP